DVDVLQMWALPAWNAANVAILGESEQKAFFELAKRLERRPIEALLRAPDIDTSEFEVSPVPLAAGPQEARAEGLLGARFATYPEARNVLKMSVVELLRNVVQHSRAKRASAGSQRRWSHNREFAQVAVADDGIGIFASLRGHHPTLTDAEAALDKALWPHISGTFDEGLTGSGENAGLGLFMIAEMTKLIGGRLMISTRGATLMLTGDPDDVDKHTIKFLDAEYPGTLVVFDIPVEQVYDFDGILETIRKRIKERTPQRAQHQWLKFEDKDDGIARFPVKPTENTQDATNFAREKLRPVVFEGKSFVLDFDGVDICTQSYLHALLFEVLRLAWATKTPIYVVNAKPAVRSGLELLENYALGG
ncbi:MAG TPA: ATP-binding protein, partial [Myxococcota bacterium]